MKFLPFAAAVLSAAALQAQSGAPPLVKEGQTKKVTEHVWVIPDGRVNLVPNIGIVQGRNITLVVDSGMGPKNGEVTLREARKISPTAPLYLTTTHFHPEHVSGFQAFPATSRTFRPAVQQEELGSKSWTSLIELFSKMSPVHADLLRPVRVRQAEVVYGDFVELDLGGVTARLVTFGPAHTKGDNFVYIKEDGVVFGGDVITNRFFPIFLDESPANWIKVLDRVAMLQPKTVVPGHGEVAGPELISTKRAFIASLEKRTVELKNQGKSADETAELLSKEARKEHPDWADPDFLVTGIKRMYADAPAARKR